jgi:hypothetical protein
MFLKGMSRPGMQQLVKKLAGVSADLFRLARHVLADDRQETRAKCVLNDEPQTDKTTCGHNLGTVLYQVDQRWKQELQEPVNLVMKLLRHECQGDATFSHNLRPKILHT